MTVAERLTPERLAEIRLCLAGDPDGLLLAEQRYLFAHIDAQQAEIDRLLKANDYLRGQIFRGPGACYCVCHNPLSSCGYCQHCKGDNSVGEFHRLVALLGEAREALIPFARGAGEHYHREPCRYCRAGAVLAKLAKEKIK